MASKTQICNRALSIIGEEAVVNIDSVNTKPARVIASMYDSVRDAMFAIIPWNFATKRVSLAPDADAPTWGWTYAYTIPTDFISLYRIYENPPYVFEGGKILTDVGTVLKIQYIAKITNTEQYSPSFNEAFSSRLALEAIEIITQSNTKKADLFEGYKLKLNEAMRIDALENPIEYTEEDDWVLARL